jgi:hypothetical protein
MALGGGRDLWALRKSGRRGRETAMARSDKNRRHGTYLVLLPGPLPVQRLNARENALGSEKPTR